MLTPAADVGHPDDNHERHARTAIYRVVSARQFDTVSPALLRITRERTANMLPSPQGLTEDEDILSPATGRDHTGLDGVYLELGPTWR